ncbi:MAG: RDD family protein [Candidatus Eisenbacteria bacterium]
MSVVVDMFSMLVCVSTLEEKYPGGLQGYIKDYGDFTFCADSHLTRVGFMDTLGIEVSLMDLEKKGLNVAEDPGCPDVAVVDQDAGLFHPCPWLEFAKHPEGYSICWLKGTEPGELAAPPGWTPSDSRGNRRMSHEEMARALADGRATIHVGDEIQELLARTELERKQEDGTPSSYLASRWKRLWGYMIDYSLVFIPTSVIALLSSSSIPSISGRSPYQWFLRFSETPAFALGSLIMIAIAVLQVALLVKKGQTFGKWCLDTRIVTMDNRHPKWWRLVLIRPLIILIGALRPDMQWTDAEWGTALRMVLGGLALINALRISFEDRRALHDILAGTQVIDLKLLR